MTDEYCVQILLWHLVSEVWKWSKNAYNDRYYDFIETLWTKHTINYIVIQQTKKNHSLSNIIAL